MTKEEKGTVTFTSRRLPLHGSDDVPSDELLELWIEEPHQVVLVNVLGELQPDEQAGQALLLVPDHEEGVHGRLGHEQGCVEALLQCGAEGCPVIGRDGDAATGLVERDVRSEAIHGSEGQRNDRRE